MLSKNGIEIEIGSEAAWAVVQYRSGILRTGEVVEEKVMPSRNHLNPATLAYKCMSKETGRGVWKNATEIVIL